MLRGGEAFDLAAPVPTTYPCRALEGLVAANERKVLVFATSLAARPQPNNRNHNPGVTFTAIDVKTEA